MAHVLTIPLAADTDWSAYEGLRTVTLTDGSRASFPLMCRQVGEEWSYRRMTPDEEFDYVSTRAW